MTKFLNLFFILLLTTACIKTADQVQRERRLESMTEQMSDSQGLMADMVSQLKDMQGQLDRMNGRLEEMENHQRKIKPEGFQQMSESMALMKEQREADSTQMMQIQNELKEQRGFLEKVTASLGSMNKPAAQKKNAKEELNSGLELVKNNKFKEARNELEALIDHKDLTPGDHNKVLHALGRVEFYTKGYEKALVYFSKIYTRYPKSSLAPSSLLFIGKTLQKMGKKNEAQEAFAKVVEDYPASKEAAEAKNLL